MDDTKDNINSESIDRNIGLIDSVNYAYTFYDALKDEFLDKTGKSQFSLNGFKHYKNIPTKLKSTISVNFGGKFELDYANIYKHIFVDTYNHKLIKKNIPILIEEYDLKPSRIVSKKIKTYARGGFKNRVDCKIYIGGSFVNIGIFSNRFHITGGSTIKGTFKSIFYMYEHLQTLMDNGIDIFKKDSPNKKLTEITELIVEEYLINSSVSLFYPIDKIILNRVVSNFDCTKYPETDIYKHRPFIIDDQFKNCKPRIKIPYAQYIKQCSKDHNHTYIISQTGSFKVSSKNSKTLFHAYQFLERILDEYVIQLKLKIQWKINFQ